MPEIVRSRLARKTGENSAHPDANLLAAFAERTLLERERAAVVAHLVECADCRECVALALAAAEPETAMVAKQPATFGGWLREWRWGLSAAAACCIVAGALLRYSGPPAKVVPFKVAPPVAEPEIAEVSKPEPIARPAPLKLARKKKVEAPPSNKPETPVLLAADKSFAPEETLTQPPPAPGAPSAETTRAVRLEAPKPEAASPFVDRDQVARAQAAAPKQTPSASAAKLFGTQAGVGGAVSGLAMQTRLKATAGTKLLKSVAEAPQVLWSINASPETAGKSRGVVQRSLDAGETWQAVPLSERASFRAVASFGADVWAGGSDGILFHSADGGAHWTEVKVAGESGQLSGDIVKIDVRGPNQVTVTTSTQEVWTSRDGQLWMRE